MRQSQSIIEKAQLVLPGGILNAGTLRGGQITKISTVYSAFFMLLMEMHLALIEWVDTKSSSVLDRLLTSEAYSKLKNPQLKDPGSARVSAIAESSFNVLSSENQNLILALAELNIMRTKGEDQLVTGLGSSCFKYATRATECLEDEASTINNIEMTQYKKIEEIYPTCQERIFGSKIAVLRERALRLRIPSRQLSITSSLEAIREAVNYGIGKLNCKPLPSVSLVVHAVDQSNIDRRLQKNLNDTELQKTIESETNPVLLAEKLRQLKVVNDEIDKTLHVSDQPMFHIEEKHSAEPICPGLLDLQRDLLEICAETMMLREKLELSSKKDFADQIRGVHDQTMQCLSKSAAQLKELNDQIEENRTLLENKVDSLEKVFFERLDKTNNKTEKYNIGVCLRAISKALSQTRDHIESSANNQHRKNVSILLERITLSIKNLIK